LKRVESNQVRVVSDQVLAQPIVPGKSIDGIGFFCPIPIVKTWEALRTMAVVQILEMLSDDPGSEPDMKSWARKTGNELLEITKDGAVYRFLVRKVR
jgi:tRNA 2-thiouridine synthesizing protein A